MTPLQAVRACCALDKNDWKSDPFDVLVPGEGVFIVATNGHMAVAVGGSCGKHVGDDERHQKVADFITSMIPAPGSPPKLEVPTERLRAWAGDDCWGKCPCGSFDCQRCDGEHVLVCYACEHSRPCPDCRGPNRCDKCDGFGVERRERLGSFDQNEIGFSLRFLATALRAFTGETVRVWYDNPLEAIAFRCDDGAMALLMPVRLAPYYLNNVSRWEDAAE